jgi:DNA polymerase-3 subunit delta'
MATAAPADVFADLPAQPEAARLLAAALPEPSHAYLFWGPPGTAKRRYALRFAEALLRAERARVENRTHPDLFVLEPEGASILMDRARALRRDLYLRPFEADRRVYLVLDAHLLRDDSANALLKSLEEPPAYGVFVLVSDHAERMLDTIRSRVEPVPFRRFSRAALAAAVGDEAAARAAAGDLRRAEELARDGGARERRAAYRELARAAALDPAFDPNAGANAAMKLANERGRAEAAAVTAELERRVAQVDDDRERRALERRYEERAKRTARRAEWDELRLAVDTIGGWYRDRLAASLGAEDLLVDSHPTDAAADAPAGGPAPLLAALSVVAETRRSLELNVHPTLAVEALFHRLRQGGVRP